MTRFAELTGRSKATILKATRELGLEPQLRGREHLYESRILLDKLYEKPTIRDARQKGPTAPAAPGTDYNREKTLLTQRQREKIELEIETKAGALVSVEAVAHFVTNMIAMCKVRLLAIPTKLAPEAALMDDPNEIQALAREFVVEALDELRDYDGTARAGE